MTRLIELRAQEKSRADTAVADARRKLHIVDQQVEAAKAEAGAAATSAADLQAEHAKLEAELCQTPMPANQAQLVEKIETNLKAQRLANHGVSSTAQALNDLEQLRADLTAAMDAAQTSAASAKQAYDDADKQEEQFASWRAALDAAATVKAVNEAGAARSADPYKKAAARVTRLLSAELLELYRQRAWFAAENLALASNRALDAMRAAADARAAGEPLAAERQRQAARLARIIDLVQDAAEVSVSRLASAKKQLAEIALRDDDREKNDPPDSVLARMQARASAAKDAADEEKQHFDTQRLLHDAESARTAAELKLLGAEPEANVETDPEIEEERLALVAAQAAANDAEGAYLSVKPALDDWEIAVPPALFADVVAFFDAEMALDKVKAVDVGALKDELAAAEGDYAAAEAAELTYLRGRAAVDAQVGGRQRRQAASSGMAAAHKLLTIRGDR